MNRYSWLEGYLLSMPGAVTQDRNMPPMLGGLW